MTLISTGETHSMMRPDSVHWFADHSKLEKLLGVPEGFLERLSDEDDWSFVIKAHALIEAAVTQMLITKNDPRIAENFRKLNLGGNRTGKLAFSLSLGLISKDARAYIDVLSELRNSLVHDIRHLSFSCDEYFAGLSKGELRRWASAVTKVMGSADNDDRGIAEATALLVQSPKSILYFAVLATLANALFTIEPEEYQRALERAKRTTPGLLVALFLALILALNASGESASEGEVRNSRPGER